MTENLPAQKTNKPVTLRDKITSMQSEFRKALPGHIPVERFVRTVQTAVQMNPQIAKAAESSTEGFRSLMAACTKAATDGLIIDGREAALVTFRTKTNKGTYEDRVQYIPMVAGLMKKARNSGEIASIAAHVVYSNDKFTYVLGDDERIEHQPAMSDRGSPVAVYAIVRLKDGSVQREVMSKDDVMRIAKQSKNANQYQPDSPNFGEWWRKTVIRRISKYLPSSSDRDEFMQAVERIDEDFDFDAQPAEQHEPQPTRKKRGGAAEVLKNVAPEEPAEQEPQVEDAEIIEHDEVTGEVIEAEAEEMPEDDI